MLNGFALVLLFVSVVLVWSSCCTVLSRYRNWQSLHTHAFVHVLKAAYWKANPQGLHTYVRIGTIYVYHTAYMHSWTVRYGSDRGVVLFHKTGRYVTSDLRCIPAMTALCWAYVESRSRGVAERQLKDIVVKTKECKPWIPTSSESA